MTFAGKIDKEILTKVLMPALQNFDDMTYDVSPAKQAMVDFICKNCRIPEVPHPPKNIDKYGLCVIEPNGLSMTIRDKKGFQYLFCVTSGNVYVANTQNSQIMFCDESFMTFDNYIMILQNSSECKVKLLYTLEDLKWHKVL